MWSLTTCNTNINQLPVSAHLQLEQKWRFKVLDRRFLLKNEIVEDVLNSPFFKDMVVSNA